MINELEVPAYLHDAFPEIDEKIKMKEKISVYSLMQTLVDFTSQQIQKGNLNAATKCFKLADKLYTRGNSAVKNAVDNVFVYSLSNLLGTYPRKRTQLLSVLPIGIYTLYIQQLKHSGGC